MTWEEAILWLRAQANRQDLVRACYYDDPLEDAAERFRASEEWAATCQLLKGFLPGRVLDLGAGRGIVSQAFAHTGSAVTACEPEASAIVGRAAIESLATRMGKPIEVVDAQGEALPFAANSFDVVYGRAVLHHAGDLGQFCSEAARVLRPGGAALFVREHVISRPEDLAAFQAAHPLHPLCGSENAYPASEYESALVGAGLRLRRVLGPLEDPVNYFPATRAEVDLAVAHQVAESLFGAGKWSGRFARLIVNTPGCRRLVTRWLSRALDTPGRHYAFLGVKP